jgi:hypothetical protein
VSFGVIHVLWLLSTNPQGVVSGFKGDIFLFTSSGTGKFNKVGRVTSKKVVPASEADKYWSRMNYQMGGPRRSNIGFPLLILFAVQPVEIDWNKNEVMALCGKTNVCCKRCK